jgi:hypothetical protein
MFQNKTIFLISMILLTILLSSTCYCIVFDGNEKPDSMPKFNNGNYNNMNAGNNFTNRNNNLIKRDTFLNYKFYKDFSFLDRKYKIHNRFNDNNSNFKINDFKPNLNFDYNLHYTDIANNPVIIYANETQSIRELVNISENIPENNVVIILTNNTYNVGSNESITINKNLTIKGANDSHVLLKEGSSKGIFKVLNNVTLFLENIEIDNLNIFSRDSGIIENMGNLYLNNCIFNNNSAVGKGYVIYNLPDSNSLISNCIFNYNNMSVGGVLFNKLSRNVTVYKSRFENNSNQGSGSAIQNDKSEQCTIVESNFNLNSAGSGGAIYNKVIGFGQLSSERNNFSNNHANTGGAIYNDGGSLGLELTSNNFNDNKAGDEGGAIYNIDCNQFTIKTSIFANNNAIRGGAVYTTSAVANIQHSIFRYNHAKAGGAVFNNDGKKYSYVYDNSTFGANGDNEDYSYGGAIVLINANFQFTRSKFLDNTANKGAAIYLDNKSTQLSLKDTIFRRNKINSSSNLISYGGAIYGGYGTSIDMKTSEFTNNSANYGGSICSYSNLNFTDCNFTNSTALANGGSIFSPGRLYMFNSLFENNNGSSGGAIYKGSNVNGLNIGNSSFKNNSANINGGAIYNDLSKYATIDNSNFSINNANNGGALYDAGSYFNITNSYFNNNIGKSGTAFYFNKTMYVYLINSYINETKKIKHNTPELYVFDPEQYQKYIYIIYSENATLTLNNIPPTTVNTSVNITGNLTNDNMGIANKTITINITLPNGTIKEFNTTTNSTGDYNYSYTPLIYGEYNVTTNFMGDNYYNPSNCSTEFNAGERSTELTLNNIPPTTVNNPVNITGNLTNNNMGIANKTITINITLPNGTIEKFNTTTNSTGDYNYSYTPLINGEYNITVNFLGNEEYDDSTSSNTLMVSNIHFMNVTATNPNDTVNITGSLVDDNGLGVGGVNINCNNVTTSTNPDGSFSIIDNSHHISPGDKTINSVNYNVNDTVYIPPTVTYYNYTRKHHMYLIRVSYLFAESNTTEVSFNYTFNTTEYAERYSGHYNYIQGRGINSTYDSNTGLIQINFNVPVNELGEARIMFYI